MENFLIVVIEGYKRQTTPSNMWRNFFCEFYFEFDCKFYLFIFAIATEFFCIFTLVFLIENENMGADLTIY